MHRLISVLDGRTCQTVPFVGHLFSYSKTCLKRPLSKGPKFGFQYHLSLNAGQKYFSRGSFCNTFIKLLFVLKIFVMSFLKVAA